MNELLNTKLSDVTRIKSWKTRKFAGDESTNVTGTFDFSNMTVNDLIEYAMKSLVIDRQKIERGIEGDIPTNPKIMVEPISAKTRVTKAKVDINKLDEKQTRDLIAALQAKLDSSK